MVVEEAVSVGMIDSVHDGSGVDMMLRETSQGFTARCAFLLLPNRFRQRGLRGLPNGALQTGHRRLPRSFSWRLLRIRCG